jgi:curved DNA-binding protein CbpA
VTNDNFADYYETLQINPNAQPETIHRVYRLLAQMYHPDNSETGNAEAFQTVQTAYRVLSDPETRAAYDSQYRAVRDQRWRTFNHDSSVLGIQSDRRYRGAILSILYAKRINEPQQPVVGIRDLEQQLGCSRDRLEVSLWYLRESGSIQRFDNGAYAITAKGVDKLEETVTRTSESLPVLLHAPHRHPDIGTDRAN